MRIAFIMDPLEGIKQEKDTTYILMLIAYQLGHELFHIDQDDIEYLDGVISSKATHVKVQPHGQTPFTDLRELELDLASLDLIFIRKDPPFDRRYLYTTLLLDHLPENVRIVNNPKGLRDWNEKFGALFFQKYAPKTLITSKKETLKNFIEAQGKAVIKPIDGFGGRGVQILSKDSKDLDGVLSQATQNGRKKIVINEYLPEAKQGDKRILLVNGDPIGAILRRAAPGREINNLDQGGTAHPTDLTSLELRLCEEMKPHLIASGLFFVGIDMLGDKLTEVNVTSPTGLQELIRFNGNRIIQRCQVLFTGHDVSI